MTTLRFDFTGRTVVVTGGARGIGLALGRFFTAAGASAYVVDLDEGDVGGGSVGAGAEPRLLTADVSNTDDVERTIATVIEETGRVDVLVNNAGILRDTVVWKLTDQDWTSVLDVHLGGTFRFTRACVPLFRAQESGRVVNVTSYGGLRGNTGQANYAAAKAGIVGFTKTVAKELARFGVTVNAISPNAETRMIASLDDEKRAMLTSAIPLGRFAEPSEMAAAVAFLASDEARYITGVVLPVDGGMSM